MATPSPLKTNKAKDIVFDCWALMRQKKGQRGGVQSRNNLVRYVTLENVTVIYDKHDQYGRILGTVVLNGGNVNYQQLLDGHAWYYRYYGGDLPHKVQKAYDEAERQAREAEKGLWGNFNPTPPLGVATDE